MSSRIPLLLMLAMACGVVAQLSTPTLIARQAATTPVLIFMAGSSDELTSCTSTLLTWLYAGADVSLDIFVSNTDVPQVGPPSSTPLPTFTDLSLSKDTLHRRDPVSKLIGSGLSPGRKSFNWTSVNIPQGNYIFTAVIQTTPAYVTKSGPFFVQQGDDISCLTLPNSSSSTSPSPSPSPPTSSFTFSQFTTNSQTQTQSSSNTTSSSLTSVTPIGSVSGATVNKGAIAGGVVAGAVVILIALALYIFFVCNPRHRNRAHSRDTPHSPSKVGGLNLGLGGGSGSAGGKWGGLGSVDSHMAMNDTAYTTNAKKSRNAHTSSRQPSQAGYPSRGGVAASQDDIQSYRSDNRSRAGSVTQHYGGYQGSSSEEKFASGSPPDELVLATLPYRNPSATGTDNPRSYSSSTAASDHPVKPASQRRHSQTYVRRDSLDAQSPFATPPNVSPLGIVRTPSTGGTAPIPPQSPPQRKTPRKAVPAYEGDTSATSPATSPFSVTASPLSTVAPFDSPMVPAIPVTAAGHYSTRAERESLKSVTSKKSKGQSKSKGRDKDRDRSNGSSANASSENVHTFEDKTLVHKNSFGHGGVEGKPLHYLIPDMPINQR